MPKMRKEKRGKCKFFQSLANIFGRKRSTSSTSPDDLGNPEPPFRTPENALSPQKTPAYEQDEIKPVEASQENKKLPKPAPMRATSNLDNVKREIGIVNNDLAKARLNIKQTKRPPAKYKDRQGPLDRLSEDVVTIHSEDSNEHGRLATASTKAESGPGTPDSETPMLDNNSNSDTNDGRAVKVALIPKHMLQEKPQLNSNVEDKAETDVRRTSIRKKTGMARNDENVQIAPEIFITGDNTQPSLPDEERKEVESKEQVKISKNNSFRQELKVHSKKADGTELSKRLSQSMKEFKKPPIKTVLDAESASKVSTADGNKGKALATPISDSESGFKTGKKETRLRTSLRKGSKSETNEVIAPTLPAQENTENENTGNSNAEDGVRKTQESEGASNKDGAISRRKGSDKKRDRKDRERKTGSVNVRDLERDDNKVKEEQKEISDSTVGSMDSTGGPDIQMNVGSNTNTLSSSKDLPYEASSLSKEVKLPSENSRSKKKGSNLSVEFPQKPRRQEKEGETDDRQTTATIEELAVRSAPPVVGNIDEGVAGVDTKEINKAFQKAETLSDSTDAAKPEDEFLGSGSLKSASFPQKTLGDDSADQNLTGSRKGFGVESSSTSVQGHSREPSVTVIDGKNSMENVESGKKGSHMKVPQKPPKRVKELKTTGKQAAGTLENKNQLPPSVGDSSKHEGKSEEPPMKEFNKAFDTVEQKPSTDADNESELSKATKSTGDETISSTSVGKDLLLNGNLKSAKALPVPQKKFRADPTNKNLAASLKKMAGESTEQNSDVNARLSSSVKVHPHDTSISDQNKPSSEKAEVEKPEGEGGTPGNNKKLLPPVKKRPVKVQPKPAENVKETEVAWVGMVRRMSKDFSDKVLQKIETKNDDLKSDVEPGAEENFERGGTRASVKELMKNFQKLNRDG